MQIACFTFHCSSQHIVILLKIAAADTLPLAQEELHEMCFPFCSRIAGSSPLFICSNCKDTLGQACLWLPGTSCCPAWPCQKSPGHVCRLTAPRNQSASPIAAQAAPSPSICRHPGSKQRPAPSHVEDRHPGVVAQDTDLGTEMHHK